MKTQMTAANIITIFRLIMVPVFVTQILYYFSMEESRGEWFRFTAIIAFALAAVSDGIDGYLARKYNQETQLGRILDPIADKLLVVSALILLTWNAGGRFHAIPLWCTAVIISRDFILFLGFTVIYCVTEKIKARPRMISKIGTVFQLTLIVWTLLQWPREGQVAMAAGAALCTGIAGILYILDGLGQLQGHPSIQPSRPDSDPS